MLYELLNVRQIPGEYYRRWFSDDNLDLIIWYSMDQEIIGFQFCYKSGTDEKALTWFNDKGYSHHKIDDGEYHPSCFKMTPILIRDENFNNENILNQFTSACNKVESDIVNFICDVIKKDPSYSHNL